MPNKDKLKFHYFKNIFYLYFVKTYLTLSEYNLKEIQNILWTTYKIYKDTLETHEKTHFKKHITFINTFKDKAKKKNCFRLTGCQKKSHLGGCKKKFFSYVSRISCTILLFSIWILYTMFIWNDLSLSKLVRDIFVVFLKCMITYFSTSYSVNL